MSPTANGLKTLRLINNDISTASRETAGQGSDYKRQQFQPADGAQQKAAVRNRLEPLLGEIEPGPRPG